MGEIYIFRIFSFEMKTQVMTLCEICFPRVTYMEDKTIQPPLSASSLVSQPSCLLNEGLYVVGHKCLSFQEVLLIKSNCEGLDSTQ